MQKSLLEKKIAAATVVRILDLENRRRSQLQTNYH